MKEQDIQKQIEEAINRSGLGFVWRQNAGKVQVRGYWLKLSKKGSADLSGVANGGKRLEIEVKKPGEKQNADQVHFQADLERWGSIYILATSPEEALRKLQGRLGY